jgi:hypothetical protein
MAWRTRPHFDQLQLTIYTVATLPSDAPDGTVALVSDADTTTGAATLVVYDGSGWVDMIDGTAAAGD